MLKFRFDRCISLEYFRYDAGAVKMEQNFVKISNRQRKKTKSVEQAKDKVLTQPDQVDMV